MSAPATDRPAISAWTAISPFGTGRDAFTEGVQAGRSAVTAVDPQVWPDAATGVAGVVPDFDLRARLGRKGTRGMTRVSGLTVAAVRELLAETSTGSAADAARDRVGLVLGTSDGSLAATMAITRASLTGDQPDHVEPAALPGSVMNYAAGQAAIWHGLRGPNATIAAGRVTGPKVLNYARLLLATGRADQVLCGAAEEFSATRSWVEQARHRGPAPVPGEGAAMFLLERAGRVPPGRRVLATLAGHRSRMCLDGDVTAAVTAAVHAVLADAGVAPDRVWAAAGSGHLDTDGVAAEERALAGMFDADVVGRVPGAGLIGDTAAAGALFRVAALLAVAGPDRDRDGADHAVVTACDRDGSVACTLLQLGDLR